MALLPHPPVNQPYYIVAGLHRSQTGYWVMDGARAKAPQKVSFHPSHHEANREARRLNGERSRPPTRQAPTAAERDGDPCNES